MTTEPIAIKVTRWVCPFCSRGRSRKAATAAHIGRCWLNPQTRTCKTCTHYVPGDDGAHELLGGPCPDCSSPATCGHEDGPDLSDAVIRTGCPLWELSWREPTP